MTFICSLRIGHILLFDWKSSFYLLVFASWAEKTKRMNTEQKNGIAFRGKILYVLLLTSVQIASSWYKCVLASQKIEIETSERVEPVKMNRT